MGGYGFEVDQEFKLLGVLFVYCLLNHLHVFVEVDRRHNLAAQVKNILAFDKSIYEAKFSVDAAPGKQVGGHSPQVASQVVCQE